MSCDFEWSSYIDMRVTFVRVGVTKKKNCRWEDIIIQNVRWSNHEIIDHMSHMSKMSFVMYLPATNEVPGNWVDLYDRFIW